MNGLPHHLLDGPADGAPLVLGPSLGTTTSVWASQAAVLARTHRVLRFDLPGHGGSPAGLLAQDGSATVAALADLVLRLADSQSWDRFAYAGVSLGGAIGAHLAVHHPERVGGLAMVCSSARFGDPAGWRERAALVRAEGTAALAPSAPGRWFTPAFARSAGAAGTVADLRATSRAGYAACCDALAAYDLRSRLHHIRAPALVVAGREDPSTPPAHARELADGIPGATLLELPGASHLAPVERPQPVLAALQGHFTTTAHDDESRRAAGTTVRRAVLGDAHVDRTTERSTPFTAAFQDLITRYAWGRSGHGRVWTGVPAAASPSPRWSPTAIWRNWRCTSERRSATASPATRSGRSCSRAPSTAGFPPPTRPSPPRSAS